MGQDPGVPVPVMLRSKIFAFLGQLAKATEAVEQVHAFAVQARDARTSADRRAALDAWNAPPWRSEVPRDHPRDGHAEPARPGPQGPGRPANHYAVRLNLSHNYTRKLLAELAQLGELTSRTVRVYRAAVKS